MTNKTKKFLKPVHPGKILLEEFLIPLKISQYRIAKEIGVPPRRINEIIKQMRAISVDTALRLALFFNMSPSFWLGLQMDYDLDIAKLGLQEKIEKEVHPWHQAA